MKSISSFNKTATPPGHVRMPDTSGSQFIQNYLPSRPNPVANIHNFGPNTSRPIITAPMAAMRTAPAATSLAFPARGLNSGEATSVRNSTAVFRASAVHTAIAARVIQHHSPAFKCNSTPASTTIRVAAACTHALCCERTIALIPRRAQPMLLILPLNVRDGPF